MPIFETRHIKLTPPQLKELMQTHAVSQAELADVLGTKQPNVALMCTGKRNITAKMTTRIYDGLEEYLKPATPEERAQLSAWYAAYTAKNPIGDLPMEEE
jgi:predicted transcriptional regulator